MTSVAARVGLIIPSSNRIVEQEMVRFFPAGVQPHVARIRMTGRHRIGLDELVSRIADAAGALTDAKCDIVVFHCTATSMEEGPQGEARIAETMKRAGAASVSTTASAITGALDALGARRVVVVTPYGERQTNAEAKFLDAAGYTVLRAVGHRLAGSDAYCAAAPEFWRDRVIEAAHADADAYLLSCANISAFTAIEAMESGLGRPVVTSNQAVVWDALGRIGRNGAGGAPGRLFALNRRGASVARQRGEER